MENHPIPQDVTGFQFKLIGNMTIKQFAYLATGILLAWIFLQLPITLLIKIPLCSFLAIFGIGLAYLPVGGRPMDVMIGNFIKALFRPTQFVYEKSGMPIYFPNRTAFKTLQQRPQNLVAKPQNDSLKLHSQPTTAPAQSTAPPTVPSTQDIIEKKQDDILISKSNLAADYVSSVSPHINPNSSAAQADPAKPISFSSPPSSASSQKPNALDIDQKEKSAQQSTPAESIKPIPKGKGRNIVLPSIPSSPSLITGVTKGPRGNVLPNILVEIKDKEGNPVRAFKTNEFGRFASATPLPNGTYTIEFEDPKSENKFEVLTTTVSGQIIQPIIAISIDPREELRKSLFPSS